MMVVIKLHNVMVPVQVEPRPPPSRKKSRGVQGYHSTNVDNTRTRVNLSWGINQALPPDDSQSTISRSLLPATLAPKNTQQEQPNPPQQGKVLTETSEGEQEDELVRLLKQQNDPRAQRDLSQYPVRARSRGKSLSGSEVARIYQNQKEYEAMQRMRYLQNSLLPASRKDSMGPIFNHQLCKQVPMQASRVSGRSSFHNKVTVPLLKKNESNMELGDGFNAYNPTVQPVKQLGARLKEMYDYEQGYQRRMEHSGIRFG